MIINISFIKLITLFCLALSFSSCCHFTNTCPLNCPDGREVPKPPKPDDAYKTHYSDYEVGLGDIGKSLSNLSFTGLSPSFKKTTQKLSDDVLKEANTHKKEVTEQLGKVYADPCNTLGIVKELRKEKTMLKKIENKLKYKIALLDHNHKILLASTSETEKSALVAKQDELLKELSNDIKKNWTTMNQ